MVDVEHITDNVWTAQDARAFLAATAAASPRIAATYAFLLDTGARISEVLGLRWSDLHLDESTVTIARQLVRTIPALLFGPTKSGKTRVIHLTADTVRLLKAHKSHQAEIKMQYRTLYRDHGLVFAREPAECHTDKYLIGDPLTHSHSTEFDRLIAQAKLKRIRLHGLRHTNATLVLAAGTNIKIVSERLGHSKTSITLDTYGHVLPGMGQTAAQTIGGVLFG